MDNRQRQYKKKPVGFASTSDSRVVRVVKHEEQRRNNRAANFARQRGNLDGCEIKEPEVTQSGMVMKLDKWRKERAIRRKIEAQTKKPVFKVSVVHHKFYSPPVTDKKVVVKQEPCHSRGNYKMRHNQTPEKRITRATQRRLEAKLAGGSATPAAPSTSRAKRNRAKISKKRLPSVAKEPASSFAPENHSFKPPAGVEEIPLFGRYMIPTAAKLAAEETASQFELKVEEKPWPRANLSSINTTHTFNPSSRSNSSIESVTLRLSSENEALEENSAPEKSPTASSIKTSVAGTGITVTGPDVPETIEKSEELEIAELAEAEKVAEADATTPPRTGTPVPASFSPYIVTSRGKESARKERKMKLGLARSSTSDDVPTKDTVMQKLNISVEEEERTAQYFKFILEREAERLTELCDKWLAIMIEPDTTEDARYRINQAVGQTQLLMRKKFERFRGLVLDCETGKGEMLVQCRDLQGFWDLIHMEVKDCELRFLKLDFLRSRGWIEDQLPVERKKPEAKKKMVAAKPKISAKSSARSWILAARRKMSREENRDDDIAIVTEDAKSEKPRGQTPRKPRSASRRSPAAPPIVEDRTRVTSRATSSKTPSSLLKRAQLSQAIKSIRSPLAAMSISRRYKTPEVTMDDSISYVNSSHTPGKGILKKSEESGGRASSTPKSSRKVDFNDDVFVDELPDEGEINEALENSLDLGRALAKIDSYYPDDCYAADDGIAIERVEKRLDFEDDSFDEAENTRTAEFPAAIAADLPEMPKINVVAPTPVKSPGKAGKPSKSSRRSSRLASSDVESLPEENKEQDTSISTRVLRNRTIKSESSSKSSRRSTRLSIVEDLNISLDSSTKENSDPLRGSRKARRSKPLGASTEKPAGEDETKKRRSTRKSFRFNPDDCTACTPKHKKRTRASVGATMKSFDLP